MTVTPDCMPAFSQILSRGFQIEVVCGESIKHVLCDQIGIDDNYVEERIQTLFLNGKAVDDINKAIVTKNSTLALSAAMPGIAGATMRCSGRYSAMRSQISHENDTVRPNRRTDRLTVKLFNLIAKELGPNFLCSGIWVKGTFFKDFLYSQSNRFRDGCIECIMGEKRVDKSRLLSVDWNGNEVFLTLKVD